APAASSRSPRSPAPDGRTPAPVRPSTCWPGRPAPAAATTTTRRWRSATAASSEPPPVFAGAVDVLHAAAAQLGVIGEAANFRPVVPATHALAVFALRRLHLHALARPDVQARGDEEETQLLRHRRQAGLGGGVHLQVHLGFERVTELAVGAHRLQ